MIKIEHLVKNYGSNCAVDDISFEVAKGEIVGLLGPNGAGKSTTMNILTGYLSSSSGRVLVDSDMVKITLGEPYINDYALGYTMLLENKTDSYVLVSADDTSVDGFMIYLSVQNSTVAPD